MVAAVQPKEWRNSAVFHVWHGSCKVFHVPGMVPQDCKKTSGAFVMSFANSANRLSAAAFSLALSAAFFAYAIIPASPGLVA